MLLGIALKIAMPRMLGPEEIGLYYFAESYANMFLAILPLGIGAYLIREVPPNQKHAHEVLFPLLRFEAVFGVVLISIMVLSLKVTGSTAHKIILCCAQALFFGVWIFYVDVIRNLCLSTSKSKQAALTDVFVKLITVISSLLVLYYFQTAFTLILCAFFAQLMGVLILLNVLRKNRPSETVNSISNVRLLKIFRENAPFFISTVLLSFYTYIDVAMISKITNDKEAGLYGTSVKLQGICLFLLPILHGGFQPFLSRINAKNMELGKQVFRRVLNLLIPVFGLVTVGLISSVEMVSGILFGQAFAPSHHASVVLAPALLLTYLNTFISMRIILLNKGRVMIFVTLTSLIINAAVNLYAIPKAFSYYSTGGAGVGAAVASVISETVVTFLFLYISLGMKEFLKSAPRFALCAVPVFLAAGTYSYWSFMPPYYRIPCATILYIAFILLTGCLKISEIKWLAKTMKGTADEVSVT
jgi:O-antigen/teichoic acid export membrane protein